VFFLFAAEVTLVQAIAVAAARSPALRIATDTYRLTGANVAIASTPSQPNVAGTVTAVVGSNNPTAEAPTENLAGVGLTQLVFDGGHVLAQIPTAQALVQVARARGQDVAALAAFDNALGLHADAGVEPVEDPASETSASLIPSEPSGYAAAVAHAIAVRPDYRSAERAIVAANQTLRAARALTSPQVNLVANAGVATFPGSGIGTLPNNFVGATMTLPFYDQGIKNAQSQSAAIGVDVREATLAQVELGIESDVRQALGTLTGARDALVQAEAELRTAREVLVDTQEQYRAGITNLALLLNAQSGLTQAQTDRLVSVYALRQAEQAYLFALGDLTL
jgi:outer membrane protein TolC